MRRRFSVLMATLLTGLAAGAQEPGCGPWRPVALDVARPWLRSVASDGDTVVAVGDGGLILVSDDLEAWSEPPRPVDTTLRSVVWDGTRFVAVGDGGAFVTSPDGRSWTQEDVGTELDLRAVTVTQGGIVAVASDGTAVTVDAAGSRAHVAVSDSVALLGVAGGEDLIVAVGSALPPYFCEPSYLYCDEGRSATSVDGREWSLHSLPDLLVGSVTWANGRFLAIGRDRFYLWQSTMIWSSPDGVAWTSATLPSRTLDVAWADGRFVAVGEGLAWSTDGTAWSPVEGSAESLPLLLAATPRGEDVVAVGAGGAVVRIAPDETWQVLVEGAGTEVDFTAVAARGAQAMAAGPYGLLASTSDGVIWRRVTAPGTMSPHDAAWGEPGVVVVGSGGAVWFSSDGQHWEQVREPRSYGSLDVVAWTGDEFIAVGSEYLVGAPGYPIPTVVARSADGRAWSVELAPDLGTNAKLLALEWTGERLLLAGKFEGGGLASSLDGRSWDLSSGSTWTIAAVACTGVRCLAMSSQRLWASSDDGGRTWRSDVLTGIQWTQDVQGLVGSRGGFVIADRDGTIWLTASGELLQEHSIPSLRGGVRALTAYLDGFLAVGDEGQIVSSQCSPPQLPLRAVVGASATSAGLGEAVTLEDRSQGSVGVRSWSLGDSLEGTAASFDRVTGTVGRDTATLTVGNPWQVDRTGIEIEGTGDEHCPRWQRLAPGGSNPVLSSLIFHDGQWVGVGDGGVIAVSEDGTSWRRVASPTQRSLVAVAGGGDGIVAVGFGVILTSRDGRSWTLHEMSSPSWLSDVAWGHGTWVAVGDRAVLASPDGTSWTAVPGMGDMAMNAVAWNGYRFVAVNSGGQVWTSTDGSEWTLTADVHHGLSDVAPVGSGYLAVGGGIYWVDAMTGAVVEVDSPSAGLGGVLVHGRTWLVWQGAGVWYSEDSGASWSVPAGVVPEGGVYGRVGTIASDGGRMLAPLADGRLLVSGDGHTFEELIRGTARPLQDVVQWNGLLVGLGWDGATLHSRDGVTWSEVGGSGCPGCWRVISVSGRLSAIAGDRLLESDDARTWSEVARFPNASFRALAASGSRRVALDTNGRVAVSDDGLSWTEAAVGFGAGARYIWYTGLASGDGKLVAVGTWLWSGPEDSGTSWSPVAVILTSGDGVDWEVARVLKRASGTSGPDVAWIGDRFVVMVSRLTAAGSEAHVLESEDGRQWVERDVGVHGTVRRIAGGEGRTVLIGDGFVIMRGPGEARWSVERRLETWMRFSRAVSLPDQVLLVGSSTTVLRWGCEPVAPGPRRASLRLR